MCFDDVVEDFTILQHATEGQHKLYTIQFILDSVFHEHLFSGFQNLDYLTWGYVVFVIFI